MREEDKCNLASIRKNIFLSAYGAGMGHLASAFSCVEILYSLYCKKIMNYCPQSPDWEGRDRMILSKGHGSLALYCVLSLAGFFDPQHLSTFSQPGTILGGEPNPSEVPGVEAATGSLGHGLPIGVGMALGFQLKQEKNKVFVVVGDGECEEGSIWEAVMAAAHYRLGNLIVIMDCNHMQKMGTVENILGISSWKERWESFGWDVKQVDGHDVDALCETLTHLEGDAPHLVIANTVKGKGVSFMENSPAWHWRMPNKRQLKILMQELNIAQEELDRCKKHI